MHGKQYRLENLPSWLKELCEFASFNEVKGYQLSEKKDEVVSLNNSEGNLTHLIFLSFCFHLPSIKKSNCTQSRQEKQLADKKNN